MLNVCPKESDRTEAACSLFCLLAHQVRPLSQAACVKVRRGWCPPPTSGAREGQVGQVALMHTAKEASFGCEVDRTGFLKIGKTLGGAA